MLRDWKKSMQEFQQTASEKHVDVKISAKEKWNSLQEPPSVIPSSWDEKIDANGNIYYIDRNNGEMYRISGGSKKHRRIDTNEKISLIEEISIPKNNRSNRKNEQSDHSHSHSSTTIAQSWLCTQCTMENDGNLKNCCICDALRPASDHNDNDSMFDLVNEAINQSLLAMGNVEISKLTDFEKVAMLNFIDFTDCKAEIALEYLPKYNWDAQAAMVKFFEDHPGHFDEPETTEINEEAQERQKEIEKEELLLQQQRNEQLPNHNRMSTDQKIELAVMESQTQAEFDICLSEYLETIEKLKQQLLEERAINKQLTKKLNDRSNWETKSNLKKVGVHPRGGMKVI